MASTDFRGAESYNGGRQYFALTAAMGTTPQPIKQGGGRLCRVHNPGSTAQTVSVSFYDSATNSTTGAQQIGYVNNLAAGGIVDIQLPYYNGLLAVASGAVTGSVLITYV